MLSSSYLWSIFKYKSGSLFWAIDTKRVCKGNRAGYVTNYGRRQIMINSKAYLEHRLIFMMFHGYVPKEIDHKDGDKANNKISNLRPATSNQNKYNIGLKKSNTSGYKGVSWDKGANKWRANIFFKGQSYFLGLFCRIEDAANAYAKQAKLLHKDFVRLS